MAACVIRYNNVLLQNSRDYLSGKPVTVETEFTIAFCNGDAVFPVTYKHNYENMSNVRFILQCRKGRYSLKLVSYSVTQLVHYLYFHGIHN